MASSMTATSRGAPIGGGVDESLFEGGKLDGQEARTEPRPVDCASVGSPAQPRGQAATERDDRWLGQCAVGERLDGGDVGPFGKSVAPRPQRLASVDGSPGRSGHRVRRARR